MIRWKCPNCGSGKLAPQRPRKDDVRRYCLRCSERTGRLVERAAPVLEVKRELAAQRQDRKRKAKAVARKRVRDGAAARLAARREFFGYYQRFARRALRLKAWETDLATNPPEETWEISGNGRASGWGSRRRVKFVLGVTAAANLELILHELAHAAYGAHRPGFPLIPGEPRVHNSLFRDLLCRATEEVTGQHCTGRTTAEADAVCRAALSAWLASDDCWWTPPPAELAEKARR